MIAAMLGVLGVLAWQPPQSCAGHALEVFSNTDTIDAGVLAEAVRAGGSVDVTAVTADATLAHDTLRFGVDRRDGVWLVIIQGWAQGEDWRILGREMTRNPAAYVGRKIRGYLINDCEGLVVRDSVGHEARDQGPFQCVSNVVVTRSERARDHVLEILGVVGGSRLVILGWQPPTIEPDKPVIALDDAGAHVRWADAAGHVCQRSRGWDEQPVFEGLLADVCHACLTDAPNLAPGDDLGDGEDLERARDVHPGRALLIAGSTLTGLGVVGAGIIVAGGVLAAQARLDPGETLDDRNSVIRQGHLGNQLMPIGSVIAGALLVPGLTMLGVGAARSRARALSMMPVPAGIGLAVDVHKLWHE